MWKILMPWSKKLIFMHFNNQEIVVQVLIFLLIKITNLWSKIIHYCTEPLSNRRRKSTMLCNWHKYQQSWPEHSQPYLTPVEPLVLAAHYIESSKYFRVELHSDLFTYKQTRLAQNMNKAMLFTFVSFLKIKSFM